MASLKEFPGLQRDLISANHILHFHNVVDAYGHISVRHPTEPSTFMMSGSVAPAVVSSANDLIQYRISDCSPVDENAKKGYSERFIHGEIYKRFPDVNSVVHSHAEAVLPYTMNGVPLKPVFHIPGFLGTSVPIYDISKLYKVDDAQDMLVNREQFGSNLADHFIKSPPTAAKNSPDYAVVLMKNHGFTAVGSNVPQAVYRAVYTQVNARTQTNAIMLRNAFLNSATARTDIVDSAGEGGLAYLSEEQVEGCSKMAEASQDRPWGLWVREVETHPLYSNKAPRGE